MDLKIASLVELGKDKIEKLPFSIRILLENALRNKDNFAITQEHVDTLLNWNPEGTDKEVPYKPARVLMQDFTGVPAVVDIASIRSEVIRKGKDGSKINPLIPVDLVIDHSVQVDYFGTNYSLKRNVDLEYERNLERYQFLKWAQNTFKNFTVVPPGMGICHQVNLEYLATGIVERDGWAFPDTLVGTDSHTPMVNGIGVLGWGVGGIEAEAAILGQPMFFTCPQVIGLKLTGNLQEGITATDMVLEITQLLRNYGVVNKFVEVFGEGVGNLSVTDRATISNMSPEFGCTVTYFPIDDQTLDYMRRTNRSDKQIKLVEDYCKSNLLWRENEDKIVYSDVLELNLDTLQPNVAGPKRPQDKILVKDLGDKFQDLLDSNYSRKYLPIKDRKECAWLSEGGSGTEFNYEENVVTDVESEVELKAEVIKSVRIKLRNEEYILTDGDIAIAAITSCTNTSNPNVMLGAGLVARKAIERGLQVKPWVKTSLAPGSKVVTEYLQRSGLLEDLEALKFHLVGYGCTSCIGNSGPLPPHVERAIDKANLVLTSVVSGNRNFEARIHPKIKMNFLASPMLVVAYALVGKVDINILEDVIGYDPNGEAVYLKDIWPTQKEINDVLAASLTRADFESTYSVIFDGEEDWQKLDAPTGENYTWGDDSTYIKEAPFFQNISTEVEEPQDIENARVLLKLGDSVTTDHISPAGSFSPTSPAGMYLLENGVEKPMFNSYGSRRGNHEVMMRGTFANVRINNELSEKEGGYTTYLPTKEPMSVYDAAMKYIENDIPLVIIGGKEYGSGSSRDWAAKGTALLGVKAVIVESFERIHRSNLVGMGVLPLEMIGTDPDILGLDGTEKYTINGISEGLTPSKTLRVDFERTNGEKGSFDVLCRLDSEIEIEYYKNGGILHYVLREFLKK